MSAKLALLGLFLCVSSFVYAQVTKSFSSIRYGENDGLRASDVYGITQDKEGYIWVGSNAGLFRFDGTYFDHYGREQGIASRIISRIYCRDDNSLLLIGEQPTAIYLVRNDRVEKLDGFDTFYFKGTSTGFAKNELWVYNERARSLLLLDSALNVREYPFDGHGFATPYPGGREGVYLSQYRSGFGLFNVDTLERQGLPGYPNEMVGSFTHAPDGSVWAMGENHLFQKVPGGKWETILDHDVEGGHFMTWDQKNRLWFARRHWGLYVYDHGRKQREFRRVDPFMGLENVQVTYIYQDRQENMWIATAGEGLHCILSTPFINYTTEDGLVSNYVTALYLDRSNRVWVGTNSGLNSISHEMQDGEISSYEVQAGIGPVDYIYAISESLDGEIIVGSTASSFRPPKKIDGNPVVRFQGKAKHILDLGSNLYFWGMWNRFFLADFHNIPDQLKPYGAYKGNLIVDVTQFRDTLWVLREDCLLQMVGSQVDTITQSHDRLKLHYRCIARLADGTFWVGTSKGLLHFTPTGCDTLDKEDGLIPEQCRAIAIDTAGVIWIGGDHGLIRHEPGGGFRTFSKGNGLPSTHINELVYDPENDHLWVGTSKGVSMIRIRDVKTIPQKSFPLVVTSVEAIGDTSFNVTGDLSLNVDQNHLRIHFRALNYTDTRAVIYQFKLSGIQSQWEETSSTFAEYLALAPGNYEFLVRSRMAGADWGPEATVVFSIAAPYWQRWYFWLSTVLVAGVLIAWVVRLRIKQVRGQELQKRKTLSTINQLEQQVLHASMNPHFIFNTLNAIQHILTGHRDTKGIDFVAEFAALVRQNMESARKRVISLKKEIENLERYLKLEAQRFDGKMDYEVRIFMERSTDEIELPSMLIQPFVENAIWHGIAPAKGKGKIWLTFQQLDRELRITIEDNGVGLKPEVKREQKKHISRGIELTRERLRILSKDNSLDIRPRYNLNGQESGTLVEIKLQLEQLA